MEWSEYIVDPRNVFLKLQIDIDHTHQIQMFRTNKCYTTTVLKICGIHKIHSHALYFHYQNIHSLSYTHTTFV